MFKGNAGPSLARALLPAVRTALTVPALLALVLGPGPLAWTQERGGGGGDRGEGGPREVAPQDPRSPRELVGQFVREVGQAGERLFRELEEELLGRAAGRPRLGSVSLMAAPQGRAYVLGLIHEDLAAPPQVPPGQTPPEERSLGILVWGPADGTGPLSALLLRGIEKKDIRRGMVIARPGHLIARGQGRAVIWEGPSLVRGEETYGGVDLRPNYIPRIVCMETVDIESEDWPGFVPASEAGIVPVGIVCVDLGAAAATGAPLRMASWKIPGSVWRHEAVFRLTFRKEEGGRHTPFHNKYRATLHSWRKSLAPVLGDPGAGGLESWAVSVIRAPGQSGVFTDAVVVRNVRPRQTTAFFDLDIFHAGDHARQARIEDLAGFFRFSQLPGGQWQVAGRRIPGLSQSTAIAWTVLPLPGQRRARQHPLPPRDKDNPFFASFLGGTGIAVEVSSGEALTIKCTSTQPRRCVGYTDVDGVPRAPRQ